MNIPLLFIKYGPISGGVWYQTLFYDSQTKKFKSLYSPWSNFNLAISRENFSDNPDISNILNANVASDIISHPIAFMSLLFRKGITRFAGFFSLYVVEKEFLTFTHSVVASHPMNGLSAPDVTNLPLLDRFLILCYTNSITLNTLFLSTLMTLCIILGPAWEIAILLFFFVLGFSLLSPVLCARQAVAISPLILVAFILTLSTKSRPKVKFLRSLLDLAECRLKKAFSYRSAFIIAISCLMILIVFETKAAINSIVAHDDSKMLEAYIRIVKDHTKPSSLVVSGYPQFVNLTTGRVSLGSFKLLDILNPRLDRYKPDYVLINDSEYLQHYNRTIVRKSIPAYEYIDRNYKLVAHNPQEHIMLFRHR